MNRALKLTIARLCTEPKEALELLNRWVSGGGDAL